MAKTRLPRSVYLDACILIDLIKNTDSAPAVRSLLAHVDAKRVTLVSSTLMLTEVLPSHNGTTTLVRQQVRDLLTSPLTMLLDVDQAVAQTAADLRVEHHLDGIDSIHVATAVVAEAELLFTRDGRYPLKTLGNLTLSAPYDVDNPPGTLWSEA